VTDIYTIRIDEGEVYEDLSEDDFMEKMMALSSTFYDTGYPHPNNIHFTVRSHEES